MKAEKLSEFNTRKDLIVTICGVILGLAIAFASQWSSIPDPKGTNPKDTYQLIHLAVLGPIWTGEILLALGIIFGLKTVKVKKLEKRVNQIYWFMVLGISCLIASQISSFCVEYFNNKI